MISRCKFCDDIAPDFSNMCDSCAELEQYEIDDMDYHNYIWNSFSEDE